MKLQGFTAALVAGASLVAAPAAIAQSTGGIIIPGLGVANENVLLGRSNAIRNAMQQIPVTYKAVFDQANARKIQIQTQLKPLQDKLDADIKGGKTDNATLQNEYTQLQQLEQAGDRELQQILEPAAIAKQYAIEQVQDKLEAAEQAVMTKHKISLLLDVQVVVRGDQAYDLQPEIVDQLNLIVPAVSITPPAGWLPRQQREQQAQAAAAQAAAQSGAATPAAATKKQPQGR